MPGPSHLTMHSKVILAGYFKPKHEIWNFKQTNVTGQAVLYHYDKRS